jgi:hypothetical protein
MAKKVSAIHRVKLKNKRSIAGFRIIIYFDCSDRGYTPSFLKPLLTVLRRSQEFHG